MNAHDETEICLIQNDYADSFNSARVSFCGVSAWPTVAGRGVSDVWPISCLEPDYQYHNAIPSPLTITITEQSLGTFVAHITAEEDVVNADFFMVATLDEWVPGNDGLSHLPHHVKVHMTPPSTGEPFTLLAGQSVDIAHSFTVQPDWDYEMMGVAAWVSRPGGVNNSPCTYGDMGNLNEVLQSRWVPTSGVVGVDDTMSNQLTLATLQVSPNPFNPRTKITYELSREATVSLQVHDMSGRLVDELVIDETRPAGRYSVVWEGRDRFGRQLPSGVYFCQLLAGNFIETTRMVLLR